MLNIKKISRKKTTGQRHPHDFVRHHDTRVRQNDDSRAFFPLLRPAGLKSAPAGKAGIFGRGVFIRGKSMRYEQPTHIPFFAVAIQ